METLKADPLQKSSVTRDEVSAGTERPAYVRFVGLTKAFADHTVVDQMDLEVGEGEFVAFLGPSGCGKTTTLNMLAGFIDADGGEIHIAGKRVDQLPSRQRPTAVVFQDYALFPNMTVFDNVAFGLRMKKVAKAELKERVERALRFVRLEGAEKKYARELSGGMKQRVALARAIVVEPRVLLLDEPLSNLDAKLRKELRVEIRELHRRLGITTIFVTHDLEEAFYLADRVAVMHQGCLEQFATPSELYARPATPFVADFVGHTNLVRGDVVSTNGVPRFVGGSLEIPLGGQADEGPAIYTVPPHRVTVQSGNSERPSSAHAFHGVVAVASFLGPIWSVLVDVGETRLQCDVPEAAYQRMALDVGSDVWVCWDEEDGTHVRA